MVKQIILITVLSMLVFLSACNFGSAVFQQQPLVTRTIIGTTVTLQIKDSVNENIIIAEQLPSGVTASEFSINPVINEDDILVWILSEQAPIMVGGIGVAYKPVPKITYEISMGEEITGKWGLLDSEIEGVIPTIISQESKLQKIDEIKITGTKNVEVKVKGKELNEITEEETIEIYDENKKLVEFGHDLSEASIDLSEVAIEKTVNSLVVNFSDQLSEGETKTLYVENNNFVTLCVKDAPIQSETEINAACTGDEEYDFTQCLSTGSLRVNGINCTLDSGIIKIENLTHSGVKGTVAVVASPIGNGGSGGGGSGGGGSSEAEVVVEVCKEDWICEGFKKCVDGMQTQRCFDGNNCGTTLRQPLLEKECQEEVKPIEVVAEPLVEVVSEPEIEQYSKSNKLIPILIILGVIVVIIIIYIKKRK